MNCGIAQWMRFLAVELWFGVQFPLSFLIGAGLDDPLGLFQLCNSKMMMIIIIIRLRGTVAWSIFRIGPIQTMKELLFCTTS